MLKVAEGKKGNVVILDRGKKAVIVVNIPYSDKVAELIERSYYTIKDKLRIVRDRDRYALAELTEPVRVGEDYVGEEVVEVDGARLEIETYYELVLVPGRGLERVKKKRLVWSDGAYETVFKERIEAGDPVEFIKKLKERGYSIWRLPVVWRMKDSVIKALRELGVELAPEDIEYPQSFYAFNFSGETEEWFIKNASVGNPLAAAKLIDRYGHIPMFPHFLLYIKDENPDCLNRFTCVNYEFMIDTETWVTITSDGVLLDWRGDEEKVRALIDFIKDNQHIAEEEELRVFGTELAEIIWWMHYDLKKIRERKPEMHFKELYGDFKTVTYTYVEEVTPWLLPEKVTYEVTEIALSEVDRLVRKWEEAMDSMAALFPEESNEHAVLKAIKEIELSESD